MTFQLSVHFLQEHDVGDLPNIQAGFVHDCNDSLVGLVHQLADDEVVEVVNVLPLDALPLVLLLLLLQHQLCKKII